MKYGLLMLFLNTLIYWVYGYLFMCVFGFSMLNAVLSYLTLSVILIPITFIYIDKME